MYETSNWKRRILLIKVQNIPRISLVIFGNWPWCYVSEIPMREIILIVILVHALSACYGICFPKTPGYGHCVELKQCNHSIAMPAQCKSVLDTPLYCCPENDIFKSIEWNNTQATLKFPLQCGETPMYATGHVRGGYKIKPMEYSWMASLQYRNESTYGTCAGSVINSRYVLTAAHCANGSSIQQLGGL